MTTVADLVAKLGFQVDTKGFDAFKKSLQDFQSIVRDGIKDLKEYAKQAEKISKAFQNAYLPTRKEAKERYNAVTESIKIKSYAQRVRAELLPRAMDIRDRNATSRERQLTLKEKGIQSGQPNNIRSIVSILKGIAGFSFGGVAGGLASLAGFSHPIVMAISLGVKAIVGAIQLVMKTIREGVKTAMSYRDYMSFTGRNTRGLSALMAASLNTTNLTPEDIMKDAAGLEKQYWDMWFGGGNPRFWQMIGRLPTGRGETDLQTILESVYGLSGGFKNRGLARSLLSQAGLSDEYIPLIEDIIKNNPMMSPNDFFTRTREEIAKLEEENRVLREWDREWKELRVELAKIFIDSKMNELLKELVELLRDIVMTLRGFVKWKNGETTGAKVYRGAMSVFDFFSPLNILTGRSGGMLGSWAADAIKGLLGFENSGSSNTNNINTTVNNQVTVGSAQEAAQYVNSSGARSVDDVWWHRLNPAYRTAGATGG